MKTQKHPQDRTVNGDLENGCVDVFWDGLAVSVFLRWEMFERVV